MLVQVMLGKGNREIADELVIAESTVKSHVDHVLRKLGARNRFHAVVLTYTGVPVGLFRFD